MTERLDELYHAMCEQLNLSELEACVEENHQVLIEHLSKADRKIALRMLVAQQMIGNVQTKNAFTQGFKLGFELTNELQNYDSHSAEIDSQNCGNSFMTQEVQKDEEES
jgi:hypothetical protein